MMFKSVSFLPKDFLHRLLYVWPSALSDVVWRGLVYVGSCGLSVLHWCEAMRVWPRVLPVLSWRGVLAVVLLAAALTMGMYRFLLVAALLTFVAAVLIFPSPLQAMRFYMHRWFFATTVSEPKDRHLPRTFSQILTDCMRKQLTSIPSSIPSPDSTVYDYRLVKWAVERWGLSPRSASGQGRRRSKGGASKDLSQNSDIPTFFPQVCSPVPVSPPSVRTYDSWKIPEDLPVHKQNLKPLPEYLKMLGDILRTKTLSSMRFETVISCLYAPDPAFSCLDILDIVAFRVERPHLFKAIAADLKTLYQASSDAEEKRMLVDIGDAIDAIYQSAGMDKNIVQCSPRRPSIGSDDGVFQRFPAIGRDGKGGGDKPAGTNFKLPNPALGIHSDTSRLYYGNRAPQDYDNGGDPQDVSLLVGGQDSVKPQGIMGLRQEKRSGLPVIKQPGTVPPSPMHYVDPDSESFASAGIDGLGPSGRYPCSPTAGGFSRSSSFNDMMNGSH